MASVLQPVGESDSEDSPKQSPNLSPLPDRIGFIGAGQVSVPVQFESYTELFSTSVSVDNKIVLLSN